MQEETEKELSRSEQRDARIRELFEGHSVPRTILTFAVPTILSQVIHLIYNLADTFFVGHTNDPSQVAALTLSFPIFMVLLMVGNLFGIGANSLMSRSLGAEDRETARKASTFAFWGAIGLMAVIAVVLQLSMSPLLRVVGARTEDAFRAAAGYLRWTVVIGGVPSVASLLLGNLIRAEGNTKQASIGTSLGGLINLVIDPVFIFALGMGAVGAGLATAIGNACSLVYLLAVVFRTKDTVICLNPARLRFERRIVKEVVLVGIPSAVTIILGSTSNIILTHYMSVHGDVAMAAFGIVQKVSSVVVQIAMGLCAGIMPLLGFSFGSKNHGRVREIVRWSALMLFVFAGAVLVLVELLPGPVVSIFISQPETVALASSFARVWILCVFGMCSTHLFNAVFQSSGHWGYSLALSVFRTGCPLIPLVLILGHVFGMYGLVAAQPVTDILVVFAGLILFLVLMRQIRRTEEAERTEI